MESYSEKLSKTWVQISNDEDYVLQNKDVTNSVLIKAGAEPTDSVGALELEGGAVIASTILSGVIWARAKSDDVLVAYAK